MSAAPIVPIGDPQFAAQFAAEPAAPVARRSTTIRKAHFRAAKDLGAALAALERVRDSQKEHCRALADDTGCFSAAALPNVRT